MHFLNPIMLKSVNALTLQTYPMSATRWRMYSVAWPMPSGNITRLFGPMPAMLGGSWRAEPLSGIRTDRAVRNTEPAVSTSSEWFSLLHWTEWNRREQQSMATEEWYVQESLFIKYLLSSNWMERWDKVQSEEWREVERPVKGNLKSKSWLCLFYLTCKRMHFESLLNAEKRTSETSEKRTKDSTIKVVHTSHVL